MKEKPGDGKGGKIFSFKTGKEITSAEINLQGEQKNLPSNKSERIQHELKLAKGEPGPMVPTLDQPAPEAVTRFDENGLKLADRAAWFIVDRTKDADLTELSNALTAMRAIKDTHKLAGLVVSAAQLSKEEFELDIPKHRAAAIAYLESRNL